MMIDQNSPFGKMLLELSVVFDRLKSIQKLDPENLAPVFIDLEKILAVHVKHAHNPELIVEPEIDELTDCIKQLDLKTFHEKLLLLEEKLGLWWI